MLFFLYFFIFSCFSKAREAVKRTSEMKFSYIELTLKTKNESIMEATTATPQKRISRTVQWARAHKWSIEILDPELQAQCKSYKDGKKIIRPWDWCLTPAWSSTCWPMLTASVVVRSTFWKTVVTRFSPVARPCVNSLCISIERNCWACHHRAHDAHFQRHEVSILPKSGTWTNRILSLFCWG